jgi:hypothetical protein
MRVAKIDAGEYDEELAGLKKLSTAELKERYKAREIEPV